MSAPRDAGDAASQTGGPNELGSASESAFHLQTATTSSQAPLQPSSFPQDTHFSNMISASGLADRAAFHVPILLLKTKSSPADAYEDIFSQQHDELSFEPAFVPVLEHRFDKDGMKKVNLALESGQIGSDKDNFGGMIFTSQRAVEAFTKVVQDGIGEKCCL